MIIFDQFKFKVTKSKLLKYNTMQNVKIPKEKKISKRIFFSSIDSFSYKLAFIRKIDDNYLIPWNNGGYH